MPHTDSQNVKTIFLARNARCFDQADIELDENCLVIHKVNTARVLDGEIVLSIKQAKALQKFLNTFLKDK